MNLNQLLAQRQAEILSQANNALTCTRLTHYDRDGVEQNDGRLQTLYSLMVQCIKDRDLTAMISYAELLAQERYSSGFDLHEVQAAFNVLEEAIWKQIVKECPPSELAETLGLISTVHGVGKDALAREYVSLASQTKAPSLNLQALFKGTIS